MLCLLLPKASVFFSWRPVFFSLFFLYFSERKSIKKENFKNRKPKKERKKTHNTGQLQFPLVPYSTPKPWQARTRRQLNHSPRLSCPYIASSPVRHTDLRAGTFAAHTRSRVPQDLVNLLRWGILKTIWRVVWYGGTYKSTGKQPLRYYPASAPALLRLAVP